MNYNNNSEVLLGAIIHRPDAPIYIMVEEVASTHETHKTYHMINNSNYGYKKLNFVTFNPSFPYCSACI